MPCLIKVLDVNKLLNQGNNFSINRYVLNGTLIVTALLYDTTECKKYGMVLILSVEGSSRQL